jgi:hypothetical protein
MKHGLEDQIKAQRQGDFTDNFIVYEEFACVQGYGIMNHESLQTLPWTRER